MASLERVASLAFSGRLNEAERELGVPEGPEERWLKAYLLNCTGRFDEALEVSMDLAQSSEDPLVAARALITAASSLRQTRRHLPAFPLDESAYRLAPDDGTRAHALAGLAADAVGLGREREAAARIEEAAALAPSGDWRVRVRIAWVRCEHALLAGRVRKAVTHARDALDRSRAASARRHEAKSLLFLGIALRDAGDPECRASLKLARSIASRIGAEPIAAVAASALPARVFAERPPETDAPSPSPSPPPETDAPARKPTGRKPAASKKKAAAGKKATARKRTASRAGRTAAKGRPRPGKRDR